MTKIIRKLSEMYINNDGLYEKIKINNIGIISNLEARRININNIKSYVSLKVKLDSYSDLDKIMVTNKNGDLIRYDCVLNDTDNKVSFESIEITLSDKYIKNNQNENTFVIPDGVFKFTTSLHSNIIGNATIIKLVNNTNISGVFNIPEYTEKLILKNCPNITGITGYESNTINIIKCNGIKNMTFGDKTKIIIIDKCNVNNITINGINKMHIGIMECHNLTGVFKIPYNTNSVYIRSCFNITDIQGFGYYFTMLTNLISLRNSFVIRENTEKVPANLTNAVNELNQVVFTNVNISDVQISENIQSISELVFIECKKLIKFNMINNTNVKLITFDKCENLTDVNIDNSNVLKSLYIIECNSIVNFNLPNNERMETNIINCNNIKHINGNNHSILTLYKLNNLRKLHIDKRIIVCKIANCKNLTEISGGGNTIWLRMTKISGIISVSDTVEKIYTDTLLYAFKEKIKPITDDIISDGIETTYTVNNYNNAVKIIKLHNMH